MITLVIIGVVAAIMIPVIKSAIPDKYEALHKKAINTLEQTVAYVINNEEYYPAQKVDGKRIYTLANTSTIYVNGKTAGGDTKFCKLFAEQVRLKPNTKINCSNEAGFLEDGKTPSIITLDGVQWLLPIGFFTEKTGKNYPIKFKTSYDGKGPNCEYDPSRPRECLKPDIFTYYLDPEGRLVKPPEPPTPNPTPNPDPNPNPNPNTDPDPDPGPEDVCSLNPTNEACCKKQNSDGNYNYFLNHPSCCNELGGVYINPAVSAACSPEDTEPSVCDTDPEGFECCEMYHGGIPTGTDGFCCPQALKLKDEYSAWLGKYKCCSNEVPFQVKSPYVKTGGGCNYTENTGADTDTEMNCTYNLQITDEYVYASSPEGRPIWIDDVLTFPQYACHSDNPKLTFEDLVKLIGDSGMYSIDFIYTCKGETTQHTINVPYPSTSTVYGQFRFKCPVPNDRDKLPTYELKLVNNRTSERFGTTSFDSKVVPIIYNQRRYDYYFDMDTFERGYHRYIPSGSTTKTQSDIYVEPVYGY